MEKVLWFFSREEDGMKIYADQTGRHELCVGEGFIAIALAGCEWQWGEEEVALVEEAQKWASSMGVELDSY